MSSQRRLEDLLRGGCGDLAGEGLDALIAAVAISQGLDLYTANPDDFAGIDGLAVHAAESD